LRPEDLFLPPPALREDRFADEAFFEELFRFGELLDALRLGEERFFEDDLGRAFEAGRAEDLAPAFFDDRFLPAFFDERLDDGASP